MNRTPRTNHISQGLGDSAEGVWNMVMSPWWWSGTPGDLPKWVALLTGRQNAAWLNQINLRLRSPNSKTNKGGEWTRHSFGTHWDRYNSHRGMKWTYNWRQNMAIANEFVACIFSHGGEASGTGRGGNQGPFGFLGVFDEGWEQIFYSGINLYRHRRREWILVICRIESDLWISETLECPLTPPLVYSVTSIVDNKCELDSGGQQWQQVSDKEVHILRSRIFIWTRPAGTEAVWTPAGVRGVQHDALRSRNDDQREQIRAHEDFEKTWKSDIRLGGDAFRQIENSKISDYGLRVIGAYAEFASQICRTDRVIQQCGKETGLNRETKLYSTLYRSRWFCPYPHLESGLG